MKEIFVSRPFKVRNAEEHDLSSICNLFVNPVNGLSDCFDYENSIIKGKMGSGKTMFLRANYVFYLYNIIPSLLSNHKLTLPVYLRLSDFQHIRNPEEIYNAIIIKIIEELSSVYLHLQDSYKLAQIHKGMQSFPTNVFSNTKIEVILNDLIKLGASEYIEKISNTLALKASIKPSFIEMFSEYRKDRVMEIKNKKQPGISDVFNAYETLLKDTDGNILLLIDEVGSIDKAFFSKDNGTSFFEVLMNQLRTSEYIRTKIAIYPHTHSDVLVETRYGNLVLLDENIIDDEGYYKFRKKSLAIIDKYINIVSNENIEASQVFDVDSPEQTASDCIEQIINASNGNTRRLIQLLDLVMKDAYSDHLGTDKIRQKHVLAALRKHSFEMENLYYFNDIDLLKNIAAICKRRKTYMFQFPYKSPVLLKYTSKSEEHNILSIVEAGGGRRGNTYKFDYSFCVAHDIPTHHMTGTDKIDKNRSRITGSWARNVAQISEELLESAGIPGKIEGIIQLLDDNAGFIKGEDDHDYYFTTTAVVPSDNIITSKVGDKVRFLPSRDSDTRIASSIEVL